MMTVLLCRKRKSSKLSPLVFHVRSLFICGENEYQSSAVLAIHTISVLIGSPTDD